MESDTIVLLELGADDYVSRPFSGRELLARVCVAVRRSLRSSVRDTFAFDDVNVDFRNMQLRREGSMVPLTTQEFKILRTKSELDASSGIERLLDLPIRTLHSDRR